MGFGISLPSFSGIRDAVANTVSGATDTVRDLGSSALKHTAELGRDGVDLGRRAVEAVRSVDVREAATVVRQKIGEGTEAAREGIKTGVEFAGRKTHEAADFARDHVPGGDNVVSNGIRGAITVAEDSSRFQLGVVGGVAREAVGLVGTAGQLGTTLTEMQLSPEASAEYGQKIVDGAKSAATATSGYVTSVAHDPSRLAGDIGNVAEAGEHWAGGQIDRYEQAFRDGKGFETVGMDVGTVAIYVVPIGGGPVRGALTAAARGGGEAVARGGAEAFARGGAEVVARGGETAGTSIVRDIAGADKAAIRIAAADQIAGGYAADAWGMRDLAAGERIFGGLPGQSAYYTDRATIEAAGGSRAELFQSLQVKAHPEFGYRPTVGEYEVLGDMRAPFGTVRANPAFGNGGGNQFFINDFAKAVRLVREIPLGE